MIDFKMKSGKAGKSNVGLTSKKSQTSGQSRFEIDFKMKSECFCLFGLFSLYGLFG